jgi:hypothetical protein
MDSQAARPRCRLRPPPTSFKGVYLCWQSSPPFTARERSSCQLSLPSCSSSCCNRRCEPCSGSTCRGALGALPLIGVLFCTLIAFATALSGPAVSWAQKLPEGAPRLQEHLSFLRAPIEAAHQFLQRAEDWFSGGQPSGRSSKGGSIGSGLLDSVFAGTRDLAGESFETVLVLFFLLVAGDTFLRRLVEILPRFSVTSARRSRSRSGSKKTSLPISSRFRL